MRLDHVHGYLTRREALKLGTLGAASLAFSGVLEAIPTPAMAAPPSGGPFDDQMFDFEAVAAGGLWVSPYGPDDQRGTLNEVTPEKTADSLSRLQKNRPVHTYQLGEELFNGFPAFPSSPPRLHDMFLYVLGYDPGPAFVADGGIVAGTEPFGPNLLVGNEERFAENYTFQIASQIDGLNHVGIGAGDGNLGRFYNDNYAADFVSPVGTTVLGNETMGPIVTRGVIIDIVGLKVAAGATVDYFSASNGHPVLRDDYRITIEDIEAALHRQRVNKPIGPGDVVILNTGWTHLAREDPGRYLAQEPGIYLAEARYFAEHRVAIVASDTWGLETLNPAVTGGFVFPCHQELLGKTGIRIGESFVTDAAIEDHVYDGVFIATPQNVPGATASSTPPAFLGQTGPPPRY